jgi:hypothetical protein
MYTKPKIWKHKHANSKCGVKHMSIDKLNLMGNIDYISASYEN